MVISIFSKNLRFCKSLALSFALKLQGQGLSQTDGQGQRLS